MEELLHEIMKCESCGQSVKKEAPLPVEDIAVTKFREYLRINTEQPTPDYEACKEFLFNLADDLGIARKAVYTSPKTPFVIMTIPGEQPDLPSLMLYSHTDVVPTFKDHWTHDPYAGDKDQKGDIYGRGAQDMKCVGSQYFEAIRRHSKQWQRTIHLVWGPEEETGGVLGMKLFRSSDDFHQLNIGFVLDEGLASEDDEYKVFYGERTPLWLKVTCMGSPGHGSKFIENTAGEKLQSVMNSALAFREMERQRMIDCGLPLGDVTTLNLTALEGGVQINVLPERFVAYFDIRVPPTVDFAAFEARVVGWCKAAGTSVTAQFVTSTTPSADMETVDIKSLKKNVTSTDSSDPWWSTMESALNDEGCKFNKEIFTAATDSRFIRVLGIPAIGFSPMINTPSLLHDHDEKLNEAVFLRGVAIYETLIDRLASTQHK